VYPRKQEKRTTGGKEIKKNTYGGIASSRGGSTGPSNGRSAGKEEGKKAEREVKARWARGIPHEGKKTEDG